MKKIWSKKHSLRLGENWSYGPLQFKSIFGVAFPDQFIGYKDGFGSGYVNDEQLQECYKYVIAEIYKVGFEEYFEKRAMPIFQDFLSHCEEIQAKDLSKLSNQELNFVLNEFTKKEDEWMNYVWMVFLLDEGLTNELKRKLAEIDFQDQATYLPAMVAPTAKTAAYELKTDLLRAAEKVKKGIDVSEDLKAITDKYSYFSILNMDEEPFKPEYFKSEIDKLVQNDPSATLAQMLRDEEANQKLCVEVKGKLIANPDALRLVDACKKVAFYREYRNDLRQESYFYARALFIEIAKRANISISDFIFAIREEIFAFLNEGTAPNSNVLVSRRDISAIVSDYKTNQVKYLFNKEEVLEVWPKEVVDIETKELKGVIAYQGKVTGPVRIIFDVTAQGPSFKEGEILVATTTNLTFIPLMSKASAIVTDEGGLLTHTAIVARELKKVAIVGTKIATKVLKDGQIIEVDAEKGIVTVLS